MVDIPPLRRAETAATTIAAHLERLIATGTVPPGSKLPSERELAATWSVSRSTLREAMSELEHKRLLERTPGRGTLVLGPPIEVNELTAMQADTSLAYVAELRYALEPEIARLAAIRATPANLLQLREVLFEANENLRLAESLRLDMEFHLLVAQAAQNPLMAKICSLTSEWTSDERRHTHTGRSGRRLSIEGHRRIFAAIERHDPEAAHLAMSEHLSDVRQRIDAAQSRSAAGDADAPGDEA
ncbi:FadR/GntR family transcriptional regulator [Naasia aerilata]|uniref:GntR family transcriptional regulator n=1 Tax=Naasia aerilata TaxID=1162966 RepID=A0ABN6XHC6_9MICO|nr:FadR/GntR family transcriptional regulator [Naasia aerilata]BDZ44195.1 GntR family transcriptional regulator [Naasia aerilata]